MARTGPDGVEIKVSLEAEQIDAALAALDLPRARARHRRIWFCEHGAGLPLLARGLIVRVRSTESDADLTVKLRGPDGCLDPAAWCERTRSAGKKAKLEGDWAGPRRLLSGSLDADVDDQQLEHVLRAGRVRHLLSPLQDELLREWLVPLDGLDVLGPVQALKWDPAARGLDHKLAAELWQVDGELRFLELSIRVEDDPDGAQQALESLVRGHGLVLPTQQETKTRLVLEHLAAAH